MTIGGVHNEIPDQLILNSEGGVEDHRVLQIGNDRTQAGPRSIEGADAVDGGNLEVRVGGKISGAHRREPVNDGDAPLLPREDQSHIRRVIGRGIPGLRVDLIIEHREPAANRNLAATARVPGQADAGPEIVLVGLVVALDLLVDHARNAGRRDLAGSEDRLPVVAALAQGVVKVRIPSQAVIQGQIGTDLPGVLKE